MLGCEQQAGDRERPSIEKKGLLHRDLKGDEQKQEEGFHDLVTIVIIS
jgi:hypothetical protein